MNLMLFQTYMIFFVPSNTKGDVGQDDYSELFHTVKMNGDQGL